MQIICWAHLLISALTGVIHIYSLLDHEIYSFIFLIIILNVSLNTKSIINLEYKIFDFIGKISYGIYVYHMFIIYLLSILLKDVFKNTYLSKFLLYLVIISLTIFISWLSYEFYEKKFLVMKEKFSKILSISSRYKQKL